MSALFPSRNLAQKLSYAGVGDIAPQSKSLEHMAARFLKRVQQILDYSITNEVQNETHYAVTIEAVVGDMATSGCQNRPISHVTLFRPSLYLAGDLPHWMSQLPASLSQNPE